MTTTLSKTTKSQSNFQNYALLILRLSLVAIFLYHGLPKAIFWSMATEKFVGFGLPGFLGPITGIAEVVASVALLFGRFWKASNWILLFIIAGAIVTVQLPGFLENAKKVAGLERDILILVGHLTLLAFPPRKSASRIEE
ncbi:MAG: DoxX family protein [Cyanobacteria bacterium P01_F01_bin.143]